MSIDQLQNRLLRGLVTGDQPALLLGGDTGVARLATPSGIPLAVVADPDRLPEVVEQHRAGLMHLILVGGGESDRERLEAWWPRWQLSRQFGFHHLDVNGRYHPVKGPRLGPLEAAVQRAPSLEPLTAEEITPLIEASRSVADAEKEFLASRHIPWANIAIGLTCVIMFALQEIWGGSENLLALLRMGANPGHAAIRAPWAVLSSAFLHIGFEHLLLNMAALFSFGPLLERALGARRFLLLYVASALGGGLLSAVGHTAVVSAGASGALWGLMVGGAVLVTRPNGILPPLMAARARKRVWQPVVLNGLYSLQPGVDWLAHLGGGIVGGALVATGILFLGMHQKDVSRVLRVGFAVALLLCVGSIGAAFAKGRPWELGVPPAMEREFTGFAGVSVGVPGGMKAAREADSVAYGSLAHDPMVIEVRFGAEKELLTPEELAQERATLRKSMTREIPESSTIVGGLRETRVSALPAYELDVKFPNDVTLRTWSWVQPEGVVLLRVYLHPNAPREWVALRDTIAKSVRTTGGHID